MFDWRRSLIVTMFAGLGNGISDARPFDFCFRPVTSAALSSIGGDCSKRSAKKPRCSTPSSDARAAEMCVTDPRRKFHIEEFGGSILETETVVMDSVTAAVERGVRVAHVPHRAQWHNVRAVGPHCCN
jgi:hypothetical protein